MELKDRVIVLDEKNVSRLLNLYGDIKDVDELSKIVNRHMSVVIDEIEEDERYHIKKGENSIEGD